jgi:hypothetical protein
MGVPFENIVPSRQDAGGDRASYRPMKGSRRLVYAGACHLEEKEANGGRQKPKSVAIFDVSGVPIAQLR